MARKQHTEDEVLRSLSKKNDCKIKQGFIYVLTDKAVIDGETVSNPKKNFDLGNGSWGKIDYLKKVHDYKLIFISSFNKL